MRRTNGHKRWRGIAALLGAVALLALALAAISGPGHRADADSPRMSLASVTVPSLKPVRAVPRSFFGLSTEYWTLPDYEPQVRLLERVLSLLHVRGGGPMILRIGGDSADHARWDPGAWWMPRWVFRITPSWLADTRRLVDRMGLRVILDMNLVTGSPLGAAEWTRAAWAELPHRSIVGLEIGNEPDIYDRTFWIGALAWGQRGGPLPARLTAGAYRRDFESYARRLRPIARGVPLIGPALANPRSDVSWIARLLHARPPGLRMISIHHYALSACAPPRAVTYPTIARVLSERASAGAALSVARAIRISHAAGMPIRMTELNSVTCGGLRGVSNSFATALWAPDALFELLRAGIDGVNIHVRAYAINAPFTLGPRGLVARPLLYGMLMFARTLGADAHLIRLHLDAPASVHLKAWAVTLKGRILHVLLIDKGRRGARVALHLPATAPAQVERLLAPSVRATTGVTLAGQRLSPSGAWVGTRTVQRVAPGRHGYEVTVPAGSEALLSVRVGRS
jgi:hypothetical protein